MNWERIEELLASCDKQPPAGAIPDLPLADYAEVLARYNGLEGFVGEQQYVQLWKAEELEALNKAYGVNSYLQGVTLFGTDGGGTGYGVDSTTKRYVSVPLVGLSREALQDGGGTFQEFLSKLAFE